jgi:hypothetical protein
MKKIFTPFLLIFVFATSACAPLAAPATASLPGIGPVSSPVPPTEVKPSAALKVYTNDMFGLSFQFPPNWYGPSEYVSDGTLRVEVGSDVVYPYGEQPEHPSGVKNSYNVVIQYTKNNQNLYWSDTYQSLQTLKDGESLSSARSILIRVRQLNLGKFIGFEYITTLPESAQTDHVYIRSIILLDKQTNDLLSILGQPNNVEVNQGAAWRDVYQALDEANLTSFEEIVKSLTIK